MICRPSLTKAWIKIYDLEITVMRLSNGQSVIEEHSFHKLMDAIFGGDTPKEEEGNG
jgi:hypothetical protein